MTIQSHNQKGPDGQLQTPPSSNKIFSSTNNPITTKPYVSNELMNE